MNTSTMNTPRSQRLPFAILILLTSGVTTFLGMVAFSVLADQLATTDTVPRLIPYEGTLLLDGQPVNSVGQTMRFQFLDTLPFEQAVYTQTLQVDVVNGRFTAVLGPTDDDGVSMEEVLSRADRLLLRTTILTEQDVFVLSNPQRVMVTPYAIWARSATEFTVSGDLTAQDLTVSGPTTVQEMTIAPDVSLTTSRIETNSVRIKLSDTVSISAGNLTREPALDVEGFGPRSATPGSGNNANPDAADGFSGIFVPEARNGRRLCFLQGLQLDLGRPSETGAQSKGLTRGVSTGCLVSDTLLGGHRAYIASNAPGGYAEVTCASRCIAW